MKAYVASAIAGLLAGAVYAFADIRSPAPPLLGLVGLVAILLGEQLPSLIRRGRPGETAAHAWLHQIGTHMLGELSKDRRADRRGTCDRTRDSAV